MLRRSHIVSPGTDAHVQFRPTLLSEEAGQLAACIGFGASSACALMLAFQPVGEMSAGVNRAITARRSYVGF
jgi:hypothetical protein